MAVHTQQTLSGFIASDPQQSVTENGDTRFYVRVGQPHFHHEDSGSFTALEPTFHDLVAYRATTERALTHFTKGDSFVAEGYVRSFEVVRDGEAIQREEFVAKKIGHDLARTNYQVDRSHRTDADTARDTEVEHEAEAAHIGARR